MNNPPSSFYIHVPVDIPHDGMKHVIGKNGKWFHFTVRQTNVSGIWFNKERSVVEIWGPVQNLVCASYAIQNRINYVKSRFKDCWSNEEHDVCREWPNDEYVEVPLTTDEYNVDPTFVKHMIGKDGRHFKKITRDANVSFLWYHIYRHCVQIWGPRENMPQAVQMIKDCIGSISQLQQQAEQMVVDDN